MVNSMSSSSSSSSSSSCSPRKATLLAGIFFLAGVCLASPLGGSQQQQQLPFNAGVAKGDYIDDGNLAEKEHYPVHPSSSPTSPPLLAPLSVNLHRLCINSAHSSHWSTILPSLEALTTLYPHLPLDIWRYPRLMPKTQSGDEEECIDFTYSSTSVAEGLLDTLVHSLPRRAEVDWVILADGQELAKRVEQQMVGRATADVPIDTERHKGRKSRNSRDGERGARVVDDHFHNGYHPLSNITAFLSYQVAQQPQLVELVDLGTTYEDRIIQGVRLGKKHNRYGQPKKEVVISAGGHGREWITTSTSLYILSALLEESSAPLLETFSVLIIPTLNPDGYAYTWTSDRFFRKNRQLVPEYRDWLGRKCYGLDISRSFPSNFRRSPPGTCGPTYAGTAPLQAAESLALASYLRNETNEVVAYIDLHSYGQLLLYPWMSCTPSREGSSMPDEEDLAELALGAAREARFVHNKAYRAGRGCETMYNQDGSSVDYAHDEANVKWSFEVELRDEGSFGFTLPPDMIRPTGEESWELLKYLMEFVRLKEKL